MAASSATPVCGAQALEAYAATALLLRVRPGPLSLTQMRAPRPSISACTSAAAAAVVLDGVGQQVQQHLLQPLAVGDVRRRRRATPAAASPAAGAPAARWPAGIRCSSGCSHQLQLQRQLAGLDARQVEQLVDQRQHPPARGISRAGAPATSAAAAAPGRCRATGEAQDRMHRRARLVAHARQKLRLRAIGGLGLVARMPPSSVRCCTRCSNSALSARNSHSARVRPLMSRMFSTTPCTAGSAGRLL